ncbi:UNVERIFIED_CONTAM: Nitrogen permease regulator 2, partial [Siphonaria sp. JEL0065]
MLAKHALAESEMEASFERQKGALEANQLLERQKALKNSMQRAQKKQLASLAKAQRLAARTREKMMLAENPIISGSGTANEIDVDADSESQSEGTTDSRSEGTARSGASQEDLAKDLNEAEEEGALKDSQKAELEKNMAMNKSGSKVLSESEKEIMALEQTAQERLRSMIAHHKRLVSELKQLHRNVLTQKTKEHRRKLADLLKDHEEEIEQVKIDQTASMNELMSVQNQEDDAAEEIHAQSISSTLPQHVMEQIQRGLHHVPDQYSCVTVAFADVFDFRKLTATIGVPNTLNILNALFSKFDAIVFKYSLLYKVESVSEVFMIAGGISATHDKTDAETAEFTRQALTCIRELQQFAEKFDFSPFAGNYPVRLRFGVHSGPTSAGLVGTKVSRYGLFGDGVITATRVCGKSEPGKIMVTAEVISSLGEDETFEFEERGEVEIKAIDWRTPTAHPFRPKASPATHSPTYNVKRACQPYDRRVPGGPSTIQRCFVVERDEGGMIEYRLKGRERFPNIGPCALCDPDAWTFNGSQYDPFLTLLYAERDGCIPSSVITVYPKFIIPWRYKNKRTGEITWKIFHLTADKITSADSETIVVNPAKDVKLRAVMKRAAEAKHSFSTGFQMVDFLLKIVREALGDYGLPGGPTSSDADASLFQQMT